MPDHRRRERQQRSKPVAAALAAWADEIRRKLSRKSELAAAFRYMRARWAALNAVYRPHKKRRKNRSHADSSHAIPIRRWGS
jgi:Transposase IS66 family